MFNLFENSASYNLFLQHLSENKFSHAYLFLSSDELNNSLFANKVSQLILCDNKNACGTCPSCLKTLAKSHPDILTYPKGKTFVVDDANDLVKHILEKPMLNERKIVIINNIEEGTPQAQNKILKTLEEPPASTIFFLTAKSENNILPTIISRTRKILLPALSTEAIKAYILSTEETEDNLDLAGALEYGAGWIQKTITALKSKDFRTQQELVQEIVYSFSSSTDLSITSARVVAFKDNLKLFLELLLNEFSKRLKTNPSNSADGIIKIMDQINLANQNLARNVNQNLVIDNLLMKILEIKFYHQL